jgi:hypothetical protein
MATSNIWKFYTKLANGDSKCNICGDKITRKCGQTTGMWKHLRAIHKAQSAELMGKTTAELEGKTITIKNFLQPKSNEQFQAEEEVARIMLRNNNSFYFFDDVNLKSIYAKAHPNLPVLFIFIKFIFENLIFSHWAVDTIFEGL